MQSGKALLFVYEDEERYKKVRLEGAISLKESAIRSKICKIKRSYFTAPDITMLRLPVVDLSAQGFSNIKVL